MQDVHLRPIRPDDAEACARIIYEAFSGIAHKHNFPPDFPSVEAAAGLTRAVIGNPRVFGVVAEKDGKIVGSNFLDQRDAIGGVGSITVDPAHQGGGIGRKLMRAVIERGRDAPGIRLVQEPFNTTPALRVARF